MVFLGIDPGLATVGFGVVRGERDSFSYVDCGVIKTPATMPFETRLAVIQKDFEKLFEAFHPDAVGVEELFFAKNVTNALKVAHARGVILAQIADHGIPLFEFTPLEVKNNVCGYGQADKKQLQEMVRRLLHLNAAPRPDDAADALAIALCAGRVYKI